MKKFVVQDLPNSVLVHQLIDGELMLKYKYRKTATTTAATVLADMQSAFPDAAIKTRKSASLEVPKVWSR